MFLPIFIRLVNATKKSNSSRLVVKESLACPSVALLVLTFLF